MDSRKRGLRAHVDGLDKVLHFEDGFFGIPHQPEDDGVDIHGNRIAGQRGLRRDAGNAYALVHIRAERFDDGNDVAQPGAAQADIAPQTQHGDLLPLLDDLDRK